MIAKSIRFALLVLGLTMLPGFAFAATCTVTNTSDYNPETDTPIANSLRGCVEYVGNNDGVPTHVEFDISGTGPWQINLVMELRITEAETSINGVAAGWIVTASSNGSGYPITLNAAYNTFGTVIRIDGDDASLYFLRIINHEPGEEQESPNHVIEIHGDDASVRRCRLEDNGAGIYVSSDASGALLGSGATSDGNYITGSTRDFGVLVMGAGSGTRILDNTVEAGAAAGIFIAEMGSTSVEVSDNTVTGNAGAGIFAFESTIEATDNTVSGNGEFGIAIFDQTGSTGTSSISGNTVSTNDSIGVLLYGAEAEILGNTIEDNGDAGILLTASLGEDPGPDGGSDDSLAGGVIGSNTVSADENTLEGNAGGILLLDATISNIASVESDNNLNGNGDFEAVQLWPGLVHLVDAWGDPIAGATVDIWSTGGPDPEAEPLESGVTDADGYAGPDGFEYEDVETWFNVPTFMVVDDSGPVRMPLSPHEVVADYSEARMVVYPWDGAPAGGGSTKAVCQAGSGLCRYQVAEVAATEDCNGDLIADSTSTCESFVFLQDPGPTDNYNYILCNHDNVASSGVPLVIGLHGGGPLSTQPGAFIDHDGGCQMNDLAARYGFIAAYPQGRLTGGQHRWNDCRDPESEDPELLDEDVEFLSNLIDYLVSNRGVDPARVYVWGESNGGLMAYRLATELGTNKIAATASVVANEPDPEATECSAASSPGDMLIMAGTGDTYWMPYTGGWMATDPPHTSPGSHPVGKIRPSEGSSGTLQYWAGEVAGTSSPHAGPFEFYDTVSSDDDGGTVSVQDYGAWDGPMVRAYRIAMGGHDVPGTGRVRAQKWDQGVDPPYCDIDLGDSEDGPGPFVATGQFQLGCTNQDILGPREIWNFFQPRAFFEDWESTPFGWDDTFVSIGPGVAEYTDTFFTVAPGSATARGFEIVSQSTPVSGGYTDELPAPANRLRARFWLSVWYANLIDGDQGEWKVLSAIDGNGEEVFSLSVGINSSQGVSISARSANEDNFVAQVDVMPDYQLVEVEWEKAGTGTGWLCVRRIEDAGEHVAELSSLGLGPAGDCDDVPAESPATAEEQVEAVKLGLIDATGTFTFTADDYESYLP